VIRVRVIPALTAFNSDFDNSACRSNGTPIVMVNGSTVRSASTGRVALLIRNNVTRCAPKREKEREEGGREGGGEGGREGEREPLSRRLPELPLSPASSTSTVVV
jgi:hypothetical protein